MLARRASRTAFKSFPHSLQVLWRPHCSWSSMLHGEHTTSFFKFFHPSQYGIPRRYVTMSTNIELSSKDTLHFRHRLRFVITTNTGNTLLHVPTLHCDLPYEMASSPLPFPFPPTTTSYRAGAIFKFEMCQLAPRHPVYVTQYISSFLRVIFKGILRDSWLYCIIVLSTLVQSIC